MSTKTGLASTDSLEKSRPKRGAARAQRPVSANVKSFEVIRGGRLVLPDRVESLELVRRGIPYKVVQLYARHMDVPDTNVLEKIGVTGGTVDRRRQADVLKPDESDRFYRLARVTELAERVLEDPAKARDWLKTRNRSLGGATPFSLLDTDPGADLVEDALNRIEFGVYG